MGLNLLRALRIILVLFASISVILAIHTIRIYAVILTVYDWLLWLPMALGLLSIIAYSWALRAQAAQRNVIRSNGFRYFCSVVLCGAWLASPSFVIHNIVESLQYSSTYTFLERWDCARPACHLRLARDIFGFFNAFLVLLEVILAYRYERSSGVRRQNAGQSIIVGPAPVVQPAPLQYPQYVPMQQPYVQQPFVQPPYAQVQQPYVQQPYVQQPYAYNPAQQPGQPVAYYPQQPVMTAPYQTPTVPYQTTTSPEQAPVTPHQVPQQTPPTQ